MAFFLEKSLECTTASRLKWIVCLFLGIKPYSSEWRRLTRRRVLKCAVQLVLDRERLRAGEPADDINPNFDEAKFNELRRGERG